MEQRTVKRSGFNGQFGYPYQFRVDSTSFFNPKQRLIKPKKMKKTIKKWRKKRTKKKKPISHLPKINRRKYRTMDRMKRSPNLNRKGKDSRIQWPQGFSSLKLELEWLLSRFFAIIGRSAYEVTLNRNDLSTP